MTALRLRLSFGLAAIFITGAGLPGFSPLAQPMTEPVVLYAATELEASSNGHFVADAEINHTTIRVLVDTGASAVALSWEDAEEVGLKPRTLDFDVKVMTANGEGKAAEVMLKSVEIDGVKVRDVKGLVLQKGAMRGTLLGMSYLSRLKSFSMEDGKLKLKN